MTGERERLYETATWLVGTLSERSALVDPIEVESIADTIAYTIGQLRETEDVVLPLSPALEQWRRRVLEDRTADPLTRAAAWELTAIQCDQAGAHDLAEKSRRNAVYAIRRAA